MYSRTYLLLQNEGYLVQGCLRSALTALLKSSSAERGPLYVALFNYSIGLERLLKLSLLLDHCVTNRGAFPTYAQIKSFGHDVGTLYETAKLLLERYQIETPANCRTDAIDERLLEIVTSFADSKGRYFNLNALIGGGGGSDPLSKWGKLLTEIYKRDVPPLKRISAEEQDEALADLMKETTVYVPATGFDGTEQSYEGFFADHGKITLVMPEVTWRFARLLYPLQMLVYELDQPLRSGTAGNPQDYPAMWEICAFCGTDKASTLAEISGYSTKQDEGT